MQTSTPAQLTMPAAVLPEVPVANPTATVAPTATEQGCVMPFTIEEITRLEIQFPWGFLAEDFDVAFIDHEGNLTVASDAPVFNQTLNRFELTTGVRYVVIGKVSEQYRVNWHRSVTFRPEAEAAEEETTETKAEVVEEPVKQPDVLVDTTDWSAASNTRKKKQVKYLKAQGKEKHEVHPALQAFWH